MLQYQQWTVILPHSFLNGTVIFIQLLSSIALRSASTHIFSASPDSTSFFSISPLLDHFHHKQWRILAILSYCRPFPWLSQQFHSTTYIYSPRPHKDMKNTFQCDILVSVSSMANWPHSGAAVKALKEEISVNKSMSLISRTKHMMQLPVMMSKNILRFVKSGIGFHNFRHNNVQIFNFNFDIHASHLSFL